jgi:transcriptional regulator with XRE-family HTH domain
MKHQTARSGLAEHPASADGVTGLGDAIGRNLRRLRHIKGLTLKDLAERAQCSESLISKIETGHASPSLPMLHRIVHSLDITLTALFEETKADRGVVTPQGSRATFRIDSKGSRLERLIPPDLGHLLEGNLHVLAPGAGSDGQLMHEGEEVGYVISGRFELTIAGDTYQLKAGDSFVFRSELPHSYRNPGKSIAKVIWVSTPPTF